MLEVDGDVPHKCQDCRTFPAEGLRPLGVVGDDLDRPAQDAGVALG